MWIDQYVRIDPGIPTEPACVDGTGYVGPSRVSGTNLLCRREFVGTGVWTRVCGHGSGHGPSLTPLIQPFSKQHTRLIYAMAISSAAWTAPSVHLTTQHTGPEEVAINAAARIKTIVKFLISPHWTSHPKSVGGDVGSTCSKILPP